MTEPAKKSDGIEKFLEIIAGRTTAIRSDKCVSCGKDAIEFKNDLSRAEYRISGLCQKCQDEVFGK